MLRLLCIRHAQSTWNALGRWQGQADPPLSAQGRLEAQALAERLRGEGWPLAALVTSDLARARETAVRVGATFGLEPEVWPALREADVGAWSGRRTEEIEGAWPDAYSRFRAGDADLPVGGGESRRAVRARAADAVRALERRFEGRGGTIAVVTHLGWLRALRPGLALQNAEALVLDSAALPEERPHVEREARL
ncbi:MAG: histidine phosphatase family protein [Myxococcota bacterium]